MILTLVISNFWGKETFLLRLQLDPWNLVSPCTQFACKYNYKKLIVDKGKEAIIFICNHGNYQTREICSCKWTALKSTCVGPTWGIGWWMQPLPLKIWFIQISMYQFHAYRKLLNVKSCSNYVEVSYMYLCYDSFFSLFLFSFFYRSYILNAKNQQRKLLIVQIYFVFCFFTCLLSTP